MKFTHEVYIRSLNMKFKFFSFPQANNTSKASQTQCQLNNKPVEEKPRENEENLLCCSRSCEYQPFN